MIKPTHRTVLHCRPGSGEVYREDFKYEGFSSMGKWTMMLGVVLIGERSTFDEDQWVAIGKTFLQKDEIQQAYLKYSINISRDLVDLCRKCNCNIE